MDGAGQDISSDVGGLICRMYPFVLFLLSSGAHQQPSHLFSGGVDGLITMSADAITKPDIWMRGLQLVCSFG